MSPFEKNMIVTTIIVSFFSLIVSFSALIIGITTAKRQRAVSIITKRRVARLENMSRLTAKIIALSKPQSIDYYISNNIPYCEKIIKYTKYLSVLLDYHFIKDCELINIVKSISKKAQLYYIRKKCDDKKSNSKLLRRIYFRLSEFERLTAIYFMTEWERLKLEAETKSIKLSKWSEIYQKNESFYTNLNFNRENDRYT